MGINDILKNLDIIKNQLKDNQEMYNMVKKTQSEIRNIGNDIEQEIDTTDPSCDTTDIIEEVFDNIKNILKGQ